MVNLAPYSRASAPASTATETPTVPAAPSRRSWLCRLSATQPTPRADPRKTVVFDFDGVLANSLEISYEFACSIAKRQKVAPLTVEEYRNLSMRELKPRLNIRFWQVPGIIRRGIDYVGHHRERMRTYDQVMPLLSWAQAHKVALVILSSNDKPTIEAFVRRNLPEVVFEDIIGRVGMHSKDQALKRLMKDRQLQPQQLVYIGDEVRDIEAARAVGIASTAVLWGKDKKDAFDVAAPTYYAHDDKQLIEAVKAALKMAP